MMMTRAARLLLLLRLLLVLAVVVVVVAAEETQTEAGTAGDDARGGVGYVLGGEEFQRIREQVLVQSGAEPMQDAPLALYLAGGSCAGKSSAVQFFKTVSENDGEQGDGGDGETVRQWLNALPEKHVRISGDEVMFMLDDWDEKSPCAAENLHERAMDYAMVLFEEAVESGYHVVWDGTMSYLPASLQQLQGTHSAGYSSMLLGVTVDTLEAVERCAERGELTNRWQSLDTVVRSHVGFSQNFFTYCAFTEKCVLIDSTGEDADTLFYADEHVLDNALMQRFVSKSWETTRDVRQHLPTATVKKYEKYDGWCDLEDNNDPDDLDADDDHTGSRSNTGTDEGQTSTRVLAGGRWFQIGLGIAIAALATLAVFVFRRTEQPGQPGYEEVGTNEMIEV